MGSNNLFWEYAGARAFPRTDTQIGKAKKAQYERLGQSGAEGKRKRCRRGKSCGASCIAGYKVCMVDLPWVGQTAMAKIVKAIQKANPKGQTLAIQKQLSLGLPGNKQLSLDMNPKKPLNLKKKEAVQPVKKAKPSEPPKPAAKTTLGKSGSWGSQTAREDALDIYKALQLYTNKDIIKFDGAKVADKVNWKAAFEPGAKKIGNGSFGTFVKVTPKDLASGLDKFTDGVGVKSGQIGPQEVKVLLKVGKADMGPNLIAARVANDFEKDAWGFSTAKGMIAMSMVPGTPIKDLAQSEKNYNSYWKARAELHRLGIAHNDAHGGNVLIDSNGKGRFVDMGLAQDLRKAALAEAIGGVQGSDYQRFYGAERAPVFSKLSDNWNKVQDQMLNDGFSSSDVSHFRTTGVRKEDEYYQRGPWKDMGDNQAKKYIDMLYEGL